MGKAFEILYECYADGALLKSLKFSNKKLNHAHSKPKIGSILKEKKYHSAIAMVDQDPEKRKNSHSFFKEFVTKQEFPDEGLIVKFYREQTIKYYVVELCPDLEGWLLRISENNNIDINQFNPKFKPENFHDLTNFLKTPDWYSDFLNSLNKKKCLEIKKLKELLKLSNLEKL